GPPKGYIEAIESRLYKMESLMGELVHSNDPRAEAILAELMKDDLHPLHKARRVNYATWRNRLASSGDVLETGSTGSLTDSPPNANTKDHISYDKDVMGIIDIDEKNQFSYYGRSSGLQYLIHSGRYKDGLLALSNNTNIQTSASNQKLALRPELMELPSQELSDHLLNLYFKYVHPDVPIIYKPRFFELLKDHEHLPYLLLNSMYCIASNYSDRPEIRKDRENPLTAGDIYFDRAKALLDNDYDRAHVTTVQALVLLSIREHGTGQDTRAWIYAGMATRMVQSLGMHRNNEKWHSITLSPGEKEEQRRIFWNCYILDRIPSSYLGRPLAIDEKDVDAALPSEHEYDEFESFSFKMGHAISIISSPDTTNNNDKTPIQVNKESKKLNSAHIMSRFNCLIRLCEIKGRILQNIYGIKCNQASVSDSVISILESSLRTWFVTLPPDLQCNPDQNFDDFDLLTLALHMKYYETLILLHRPYAAENISSRKICSSSAEIISDIVDSMYRTNRLKSILPLIIYNIFVTSIIHTCNATQPDITISQSAKMGLVKCIRAIESLKNHSVLSHKYGNMLKELVNFKGLQLDTNLGSSSNSTEISHSLKKRSTFAYNQPNPFDTMDRYGRQARYLMNHNNPAIASPPFNFNQAQQHRHLRHNFQEPTQMFTQGVISPNNGVGNNTICSLNSGFWNLPQGANFEEWSSYLHSQQVQQSVTLPSQQTLTTPMSLQPLLLHDNGNNVNMFANNQTLISEFE
ncbi:10184_t:CDS:2, partial [Cetraspora pellucida]